MCYDFPVILLSLFEFMRRNMVQYWFRCSCCTSLLLFNFIFINFDPLDGSSCILCSYTSLVEQDFGTI